MKISKNMHVLAAACASLLLLSSCAGSAEGTNESDGDGGLGLSAGAPKEEWVVAFEDVEPIELRAQSPYPDDGNTGLWLKDYMNEITEWSGGKISFDIGYSSAYASMPEVPEALEDGRLDLALTYPHLSPQEFPMMNNLIASAALYSEATPVEGTIASNIWPNQVGFKDDAIVAEFEDNGMKMLLPYLYPGAGSLFCADQRDTADDLDGALVSVSSTGGGTQVEALGATTTSVEATEYYEALQRGVIDCVQTTPAAMTTLGVLEVAPHAVIDPAHSFVSSSAVVAMSEQTWEQLPLVAQQLIWDKLSTLVYGNIEAVWADYDMVASSTAEAGGGLESFDSSVEAGFGDAAKAIRNQIETEGGSELLQAANSSSQEWHDAGKSADFNASEKISDLSSWLTDENKSAVKEYIADAVYDEVFLPQRPE